MEASDRRLHLRQLGDGKARILRFRGFKEGIPSCQTQITHHGTYESATVNLTYHAISYVWGDPDDPLNRKPIICNGVEVFIPANLHAAIIEIWRDQPLLKLWADALCIDQDDAVEKSQQVGLMYRIFRDAACVQVWFGQNDQNIIHALQSLVALAMQRYRGSSTSVNGPSVKQLNDLLQHPWLSRAWTLQEITLAKRALFRVGDYTAERSAVHETITRHASIFADHERGIELCRGLGYVASTDQASLLQTLMETWPRNAKDPRDKVFALHGMFNNLIGAPDYSMHPAQVYTDVATVCIAICGNLDLLTCATNTDRHLTDKTIAYLPSWVPDWRADTFLRSALHPQTRKQSWPDTYLNFCSGQAWTTIGGSSPRTLVPRPFTSPVEHGLIYSGTGTRIHPLLQTWGMVVARLHEVGSGQSTPSLRLSPLPLCAAKVVGVGSPPDPAIATSYPGRCQELWRDIETLPSSSHIHLESMPEFSRVIAQCLFQHDNQCCGPCSICEFCGLCEPCDCIDHGEKHLLDQVGPTYTNPHWADQAYCCYCRIRRYHPDDIQALESGIPQDAKVGDWVCLLRGSKFPCVMRPVDIAGLQYRSSPQTWQDLLVILKSVRELKESIFFIFVGIVESKSTHTLRTDINEKRYEELLRRQQPLSRQEQGPEVDHLHPDLGEQEEDLESGAQRLSLSERSRARSRSRSRSRTRSSQRARDKALSSLGSRRRNYSRSPAARDKDFWQDWPTWAGCSFLIC